MSRQVVLILRRPEQIPQGLATARQLHSAATLPQVVFLCPGCSTRRECRSAAAGDADAPCYTDRSDDCAPPGFRALDEGRIVSLIREADVVVPI